MSNNQTMTIATPANTHSDYKSWTDVYRIFSDTADRIISMAVSPTNPLYESAPSPADVNRRIASEIDSIYAQHEGDPVWDMAYERWIEPHDDDEEV